VPGVATPLATLAAVAVAERKTPVEVGVVVAAFTGIPASQARPACPVRVGQAVLVVTAATPEELAAAAEAAATTAVAAEAQVVDSSAVIATGAKAVAGEVDRRISSPAPRKLALGATGKMREETGL
jgi:hypothetical protein